MDKYDKIKQNIEAVILLTNKEWNLLFDLSEWLSLKKNEYFLKQGKTCNCIGFVYKGVLVYFQTLDNGSEVTTDFALENDWVTNNQSRLSNTPSLINIKAIEPSELLVIKNEYMEELYQKVPKLERLGRILMEMAFIKMTQQSIDLQILSAKERYIKLLQMHPAIFQKVPLYHIANYLGIAPKSLSRIRKEILNQE